MGVCLFTCLVTRVIHLEVGYSLETDTFLNALQRFIARQGKPQLIHLDNGTNFVSANAELTKAVKSQSSQHQRISLIARD